MALQPRYARLLSSLLIMSVLVVPARAVAHCDGLDGPVVKAARHALETGNLALALIWVQPQDEAEVRSAFDRSVAVRELGSQAKELADQFFFETVVRLHRAGEGAPFTGLQPAGRDLGPAIPAADKALETASVEPLLTLLKRMLEHRLDESLSQAIAAKKFDPADIAAGREYVKAYVEFIHVAERLYEMMVNTPHGHFDGVGVPPPIGLAHAVRR